MKFISYAQNFEDVMLWRALKHISDGFYIDVGAAWPTNHSVTKAFYEAGWRGINIEPNPDFYSLYAIERPLDINLQLALSDVEGEEVMNFINGTGLSSMDDKITAEHNKQGYSITQKKVKVTTLNEIFTKFVVKNTEVHFLKIDVEGFETNVVKGCNWSKFRPWIVVVEATVPMSQEMNHYSWESELLSSGYEFVYMDGLNRFYLSEEHEELKKFFIMPPNVFDSFMMQSELEKEKNIEKLKLKNQELTNKLVLLSEKENSQSEIIQTQANDISILHHHIDSIYKSKFWRIGTPLRVLIRYTGKAYRFFKYYNKKESPKALVRFIFIGLDRFPRFKSLLKKLINKTPLRNIFAKLVYNSLSPPVINKAQGLSKSAVIIKKQIVSKYSKPSELEKD